MEIINFLERFYVKLPHVIPFVSSLIESSPFGWAIPGGTLIALGGFFAYSGAITILGILISGTMGSLVTFLAGYVFGAKTGLWVVKKLHQEKNFEKAKTLLEKHGGVILTTSMMAGLTRFWVAYVAGTKRHNFASFLGYASLASLTWTALMTALGYLVGSERGAIESAFAKIGILSWILLIVAICVIVVKTRKEFGKFKNDHSGG